MVGQNLGDLFGKLPDEILRRVIAFLPPETALETSLVSRRWRALWDSALEKQQSSLIGIAVEIADFVTEFDESDPLRRPRRLRLRSGNADVVLASLAPNNKLKIHFPSDEDDKPETTFFSSELITDSNIIRWASDMSFVKTLHLKSFGSVSGDLVSSLVPRFPFLERLEIVKCRGLKSLRFEAGSNLASLVVLDCPDLASLSLKTPKLRSFRYRGKLPKIWPERHFNLDDAMLDFRQGLGDCGLVSKDFDPVLLTVKNSRILTLCSWTFETMIWPSLSPPKESFQFYKLKELWWIGYSEEQHNTDSLVHFVKLCPALESLFVTIDAKSYGKGDPNSWLKKGVREVKHGKLRVIKMEGILNGENEIILAKKIREVLSVEPLFISSGNPVIKTPTPKHAQLSA